MKWIIKDWCGKVLFGGREFDSFEEGWSFIYQTSPEPDVNSPEWIDGWYDDYFVEEKKEEI